jgi:hypothetical protein
MQDCLNAPCEIWGTVERSSQKDVYHPSLRERLMGLIEELGLHRAAECLELASLMSDQSAGSLLTRMADVWLSLAIRSETLGTAAE